MPGQTDSAPHVNAATGSEEPVRLSVVVPVWNEDERNLRALHARLRPVLDRLDPRWELLFVDDNSKAPTRSILRALCAADPRTRVVWLSRRHGQETALAVGLLTARGAWVCTIDCDLQHRPEELPALLQPLEHGYDLVFGVRRSQGDGSRARRLAHRAYNTMMNARWGACLSDWGCGVNAGRREVFEELVHNLEHRAARPLKLDLLHRAGRWTEVMVTEDPRPYGQSGYRGAHFWWHAWRMLSIGHTRIPVRGHVPRRA